MSGAVHLDEETAAAKSLGVADVRAVVETIRAMDRASMTVLKDDPARSVVYRVEHGGRGWVWKVYRHQSWWKMLLRVSPAWREWRRARRAAGAAGVRVSVPVAVVTLGGSEQALLLPYVEGEPMHRLLVTCTDREMRLKLAAAVGRCGKALLDAGLVNRDLKLSNLIADAACVEGGDVPVTIDPLGIGRLRHASQAVRMWAALLRATRANGRFTTREALTCLKAGMGDTRLARAVLAGAGAG